MDTLSTHTDAESPLPGEDAALDSMQTPSLSAPQEHIPEFREKWYAALREVFPIYLSVHVAFFVITCLAGLFTIADFLGPALPLPSLWTSWLHWDTGIYMAIASHGYDTLRHTAFFPLYPFLEWLVGLVTRDLLIAGLLISDVAGLLLLVVFYQLVREDFGQQRALRSVLYLSLFPTAFYLASGYNESLFLCLAVLSFYNLRHGHWWLAGLCGLLASLTRTAGALLVLPFCYEYLQQRQFNLRQALRLDALSILLIPLGTGLYSLYCFYQFHDFLAFSHAQSLYWSRHLHGPWHGIIGSLKAIYISGSFLSFQTLRNLTDLLPDLLLLATIILMVVGPWRLPRKLWAYAIFACALWLLAMSFPMGGTGIFPLQSTGRFMLEIFPGFIILAAFGKNRTFHLNYLLISGAALFFLLTQFLTGHWVP